MSKGQVRYMQHLARHSSRVAVSGLGVDRDLDKKLKGGPSGKKKRRTPVSKDARRRGPSAYGITKSEVKALLEFERFVATGLQTDPPMVTRAAVAVCAKWFSAARAARVRRLLFPELADKERSNCVVALNSWLSATTRIKGDSNRALAILKDGPIAIARDPHPGIPKPTYRLELAAWWMRGAIIRAIAEIKGQGWAPIPPKPDSNRPAAPLPQVRVMAPADLLAHGDELDDDEPIKQVADDGPPVAGADINRATEEPMLQASPVIAGPAPGNVERPRLVRSEYERLKTERANAEHARVVAALMDYLEVLGWQTEAEVDWIDVLGTRGDAEAICEVKSITVDNETDQVRAGVAQLFEYRWRTSRPSALLWLVLSDCPSQAWFGDYLEDIGTGCCGSRRTACSTAQA